MMTPRNLVISVALGGLVVVGSATWLIHRNYQSALKYELEDSNGQVGQLRVQAEALRAEQETRRREIEAIRADIKTAEATLASAKQEADESRCQATHARVDAAITVKQVSCYQQISQRAQCIAANERERADNTLFGALLGAGAAVLTGGSSLLLTAGGGLLGASSGGGSCPAPDCILDPKKLRRQVLAEQGLRKLPVCTTQYEPVFLIAPEPEVAADATTHRRKRGGRSP